MVASWVFLPIMLYPCNETSPPCCPEQHCPCPCCCALRLCVTPPVRLQNLERGYWPSYNIPFFPEVYNRSGFPQFAAALKAKQAASAAASPIGDAAAAAQAYVNVANSLSYQLAPRAKIARRDQGRVSSLAALKTYMRSNNWRKEPFSGGSAFGAICGRGDIDPAKPKASGCNDAKVSRVQRVVLCM